MEHIVGLVTSVLHGREIRTLTLLAEGGDHLAFELDDELIVRVRKHHDGQSAAAIDCEARLLEIVSRVSPIPVPEVVAADPAQGVIVTRKLAGTSLFERSPPDPMVLVESLAEFLRRLLEVPQDVVRHLVPFDDCSQTNLLAEAAAGFQVVASYLSSDRRRLVEMFLATAPPAEAAAVAFCHNDLGAEHLLAAPDGETLTGVIDWSDAALTDPARDLGLIHRDFGRAVAEAIVRRLGTHVDDGILKRGAFYARCALIEDLTFGVRSGQKRYLDRGIERLLSTFEA